MYDSTYLRIRGDQVPRVCRIKRRYALCARLGTSRVAVWKHIQSLLEMGYDIESGAKGYRLRSSPDSLHPWEFPGREERVVYLPQVASTMDMAPRRPPIGA